MAYPLPQIVYPSSVLSPAVQATLLFTHQPIQQPYFVLESIRHDNRASSGVQETVFERTDAYWEGDFAYISIGNDVEGWLAFEQSAIQGIPFDYYPDHSITTSTVLTLTSVAVGSGKAVYAYSSFTGPTPAVGMLVTITGFANAQNNVTGKFIAVSGGASGTVTLVLSTQTNETHAATGTVAAFITYILEDKNITGAYNAMASYKFKHKFYQYVPWM